MSPEPSIQDVIQDVNPTPSISSDTSSEKRSGQPVESTCDAVRVGSDISSEPLTFHTDFSDGRDAVASSDEELKRLEGLLGDGSKSDKLFDVNKNISKNELADSCCEVKGSEMALDCPKLPAEPTDQQKVITELCSNSHYLPVTTSTVVVNMVLSSVVTRPEDQSSTAGETDAANHSWGNSECDMSLSDATSTQEASSLVSSEVTAEKRSGQQENTSSSAKGGSPDHATDHSRIDVADQIPSSKEKSRKKRKKSKSPASDKSRSRSRGGKRDRSRDRRKRRSRSSERKRDRSRSVDQAARRSGGTSRTRSPDTSPQPAKGRRKDRRRSRSSSHSRRRRSSSREHQSRTGQKSSSRSGRRREDSRSPSRENRRRKSRSRSKESKRRSRSTDRVKHKEHTRSRSKDRERSRSRSRDRKRRSVSKDHRTSRDEDGEKRSVRLARQVDHVSASSSKKRPTDRRHESPSERQKSPSWTERVLAKADERTVHEKSGNSNIERSSGQSDSDLSSSESNHHQKSHEGDGAESNRIAVISSSSGTNRQPRQEEFESDEEPPPADPPTAYDPSEPTEDNFRDDRRNLDRVRIPAQWVPPANHRMPMVDVSRPPPPCFPTRLPAPPIARFRPEMEPTVIPPNRFGVPPADGGRPPLLNLPLPLPRLADSQPQMVFSRPMLTTPASPLPPPPPPSMQPIRLPRAMNVEPVPLIVRGPMEPARLVFVPPGVGQPVRLAEASPAVVGLPRIVCQPAQGAMTDLVRLPLGQPQPPPGTILSGPPFVSGSQLMIRPAPLLLQQVQARTESPQSTPQVITNLPASQVPRMSATNQPLVSNMGQMTFPPSMPVAPLRQAQPQTVMPSSSSSASSPSSGSQDAEDMLLERYSAKPEPPQSLFASQKAPDEPKPAADVKEKSPEPTSEESEKSSSDQSQPPEPPQPPESLPASDRKTTVVKSSSEAVATSTSNSLPSDPRLLVQFLLTQTRQSAVVPGKKSGEETTLTKPSSPAELRAASRDSPDIMESPPEKPGKNETAYSPSQADYLGESEGEQPLENAREIKVDYFFLLFSRFGLIFVSVRLHSKLFLQNLHVRRKPLPE